MQIPIFHQILALLIQAEDYRAEVVVIIRLVHAQYKKIIVLIAFLLFSVFSLNKVFGYYCCSTTGSCTCSYTGDCTYTCNSGWFNDDGIVTNGCENQAPKWFSASENATSVKVGDAVKFSVNWTDNTGASSLGLGVNYTWFSWNASGASCDTWVNISFTARNNVQSVWHNETQTIPSACLGKKIAWKQYANDSANEINVSQERIITVLGDTIPPIITVQSPLNITYTTTSIWANVTLNEAGSWCGRSLDGGANVSLTNSSGNWNNLMTGLSQGSHNVKIYCNDTAGNMNSTIVYFTVDIQPPQYSLNSTNSTLAGTAVSHNLFWQDNIGLSGYIFSFYNGSGVYRTPASVYSFCEEAPPFYANKTIDGNLTTQWESGQSHEHWIVYDLGTSAEVSKLRVYTNAPSSGLAPCSINAIYVSNDPSNFGSSLGSCSLTGTGTTWRECSFTKKSGRYIKITLNTTDIDGITCGYNQLVGFYEFQAYTEMINDSWVPFTSSMCPSPYTACWSNVTKVINSTVGATIKWRVYANDTSNNWNVSETYSYVTTLGADTQAPQYSLNSTNSTLAGKAISHNLFWQDNFGLSGYIFSWCNGTFDNTSTTIYNWTSSDKESGINNIKADYGITTYNRTSADQETNTKQFKFIFSSLYPLTFTTQQVESLSVTPLNSDKFVVAWCDEASKTINFKIYSTTGQVLVDTVTADTSSGITNACDYNSVSVSALNSTHFVIAWFDAAEADATFAVYDSSGALKIGPIDEDTDVGASGFSVSVSAFNSTHIVIGYYDYTDQDATFSTWNLATQTRVAGPIDVDTAVGTDGWGVSVAALDSNNFAFGFIDGADNDATFAIYTITGTAVKTATDEDTNIAASTSVSVVALNSTHWVFAYHDAADADVTFSIYNSAGTRVAGPVDEDTDVGTGGFVSAFGINSTHWGMVYYDAVDYNHTFSIYNQNTRVVGPIDISYSTLKWVAGASYLNSINLGVCNQNWIFAEAYATNDARLFGYTSSGTQWNGYCGPATEQNTTWYAYSGIDGDDYQNVDKIKVIVTIDSYNPSASNSTYDNNNRPDIEIGIWNGTAYVNNSYCQLSNYMGSNLPNTTDWNCTIEKTDSQFLNSWKYQANRSVIIRGVWLDAYNGNIYDEINVTGVYGYVDGWNETKNYEANKTWKSYDIGGDDYQFVDKVKIILTFDSYNPSASNSTYNNNNRPDIEVGIYNGSVYLNSIYCSASTYMGSEKLNTTDWNCSKEFTQSDILDAWKYSGNRSIKIRGVWLDSYSSQVIDEINITNVYGYIDARNTTGGVYDCSDPNAVLINDTWVAFSGNPAQAWSNVTKVITPQVGATVKWRVYANDTSNNWNESEIFSYITTTLSYLEVNLEFPSSYSITQNQTFTINATVFCRKGACGNVYGTIRYNASSPYPDTPINTSEGEKPFYIQEPPYPSQALKACPTNPLEENEFCNLTWIINATGDVNSVWKIGVLFNSSQQIQNHTSNSTITIVPAVESLSLSWSSIDFSFLIPNTQAENNPAPGNSNNLYNITNTGTCNLNLWIKGSDLTNSTFNSLIAVGNLSWSNSSSVYNPNTVYPLDYYYKLLYSNLLPNSNLTTYYWLSVPSVYAGIYKGTITICGNCSSTCD
jgi:hypothetical protein